MSVPASHQQPVHRSATIEIDPVRTLLVLGPQITSLCLSESRKAPSSPQASSPLGFLSHRALAESCIRRALDLEDPEQDGARERREVLLRNAYELDPAFAMNKAMESLRERNGSERWLEEAFSPCRELGLELESSRTLQHLYQLRRKGVRLVYTHYDDTLARALGLPVVLPDDGEEEVRRWAQGFPALLHLHGVHTRPNSVKIDCICYKSEVGLGRVADVIREQFQSRMSLFIGYDSSHFLDPFLSKVVSTFATPSVMPTSLPLLLSLSRKQLSVPNVLPMAVEPSTSLSSLIKISKTHLSVAPINDSSHPVSLQLVCSSKEEVSEIFELLHQFSNIVANLTQRGDNDMYVVDLQTNRQVLQKLWVRLFSPSVISKLEGLSAIEIQGSFLVNFAPQKSDETVHRSSPSLHIPSSFAHLSTPTSLWKVPTLPHFPSPTTLVHAAATLEAQKLQLLASQSVAATAINNTKIGHAHHDKIRRNQSDIALLVDQHQRNQALTQSSGGEGQQQQQQQQQNKNGLLVHQRSAPTFPLCNPFLFAAGTGGGGPPGKLVTSAPFNSTPFSSAHVSAGTGGERHETPPLPVLSGKMGGERSSFEHKKEEFIREAQEWSKQVSNKIKKDDEEDLKNASILEIGSPHRPSISAPGGLPLIPLNVSSHLIPQSPPTATPTSSPSHKSFYYLSSPQTGGNIFGLNTVSRGILAPPISFLTSLSKIPSPTSNTNGLLATPTLSTDPKVVHVMQDGKVFATTPYSEDEEGPEGRRVNRSPKRIGSPNSDPEFIRSPKKRRRSSSLPDVNQLKSSSSPSSPSSPSPVATATPVSGLPDHAFVSLLGPGGVTQGMPPIFFSNMHLPQTTVGTSVKLETTPESEGDVKLPPPSPDIDVALHPVPPGRGPIQLWQFLLDLLISPDKAHLIQWTGNGYEFHIAQPEEIAKLWGARKNKPRMNYDKLSRGLRYYYSKGIMDKVPGKKLTFKYTCDIQQYIIQRAKSSGSSPVSAGMLVN